jgi:GNAT superfamily N-acetyltransferase
MTLRTKDDLPDCGNSDLILCHPTEGECVAIWNDTSDVWTDSLTPSVYLKESSYLTTVPLAKEGGMTTWILVQRELAPNDRHIFCSCETYRKRSLTSDVEGRVSENIVHGIASVFCSPVYRRRGYAGRMMRELIKELYNWQIDRFPCVGTTLYSDIGREYYAKLGWPSYITNSQIELAPKPGTWPALARAITEHDLEDVCERDEALIRSRLAVPNSKVTTRFTIIPDADHMGWHIGKERFATDYLFGRRPTSNGAIAGSPGSQVWATWVRRYYDCFDAEEPSNVLYILRLVIEIDETATRLPSDAAKRPTEDLYETQIELLRAVLQAAQAEAAEWKLDVVKLWDPTPLVMDMLEHVTLHTQ